MPSSIAVLHSSCSSTISGNIESLPTQTFKFPKLAGKTWMSKTGKEIQDSGDNFVRNSETFTSQGIEEDYFEAILQRKFATGFTSESFSCDITLMPEFPVDEHNNDNPSFTEVESSNILEDSISYDLSRQEIHPCKDNILLFPSLPKAKDGIVGNYLLSMTSCTILIPFQDNMYLNASRLESTIPVVQNKLALSVQSSPNTFAFNFVKTAMKDASPDTNNRTNNDQSITSSSYIVHLNTTFDFSEALHQLDTVQKYIKTENTQKIRKVMNEKVTKDWLQENSLWLIDWRQLLFKYYSGISKKDDKSFSNNSNPIYHLLSQAKEEEMKSLNAALAAFLILGLLLLTLCVHTSLKIGQQSIRKKNVSPTVHETTAETCHVLDKIRKRALSIKKIISKNGIEFLMHVKFYSNKCLHTFLLNFIYYIVAELYFRNI